MKTRLSLPNQQHDWEDIFHAIGHPILILDPYHNVLAANRAAVEAVGDSEESVRGKKCYEVFHRTDHPPEGCPLQRMLSSGHFETVEMEIEALGGVFLVSCTPILDEGGRLQKVIHVATDITKCKQAEAVLRENEEKYLLISENIPVAVYSALPDEYSTNLFVSGRFKELTGYPAERFLQDPELWTALLHPADKDRVWKKIEEHRRDKIPLEVEYRIITKENTIKWLRDRATPVLDENGALIRIDGFMEDITARKQAEESLRQSEEQYRLLFNSGNDAVFVHEVTVGGKPGKIIDVNDAACKIMGYTRDELLQRSHLDLCAHDALGNVSAVREKLLSEKQHLFELDAIAKDGRKLPLEISARLFTFRGTPAVLSIARDITERKRAEAALKESEEKFRTLAEQSPNMIFINKKGRVVYANKRSEELLGYKKADFYSPDFDFLTLHAPESREVVKTGFSKYMSGEEVTPYDITLITKTGRKIEAILSPKIIPFEGEHALLGIVTDITERKRMEDDLRKYRDHLEALVESRTENLQKVNEQLKDEIIERTRVNEALRDAQEKWISLTENTDDIIVVADLESTIQYINRTFTGQSPQNTLGKRIYDFIPEKNRPGLRESVRNVIKTGKQGSYDTSIELPKIGTLWVSVKTIPLTCDKNVYGLILITSNITERKRAEEQTAAALKERELLLQEIHHRVKNNMQVISSLLNLQARRIRDKGAFEMIMDTQSRVKSMALVHETLYQSGDIARIDFADYIQSLARNLFRSYRVDPNAITLTIDIKGVLLDINAAIPCGLIINELVSNVLKHAFPAGKKGNITIIMHQINGDEIELVVSDTGVGFPEALDFKNTESLGMQIVTSLVEEQLSGTIELDRREGTTFTIRFRK